MPQFVKVLQHNGGFISLLADDNGVIQYTTNDSDFDGIVAGETAHADTADLATLATAATGPASAATFYATLDASRDSIVTLVAPAATLSFTGLTGNTDGDYAFNGILLLTGSGSLNTITLQPNGVATNQIGVIMAPGGSAIAEADVTLFYVNNLTNTADSSLYVSGTLTSKSGRARILNMQSFGTQTAVYQGMYFTGAWTDAATAITSLTFNSSLTTNFRAGSFMRLRKLRKPYIVASFFPPNGGASLDAIPDYDVFAGPGGDANGSGTVSSPHKYIYDAILNAVAAGGGNVYFSDNTLVGGPITDQGIWLRNDGIDVPGFIDLQGARIRLIGNGQQGGQFVFERPGSARFIGGAQRATDDYTKPGLWIVGSELPLDINFVKCFDPPFYGLITPARLGWDYVRKADFSLEQITCTSATRAAPGGVGYSTFTLDLTTATAYTVLTGTRDADDNVTLTLTLPPTIAMAPWVIGAPIRVVTSDANFPSVDAVVTGQSDQLNIPGSPISVSYVQAGATIGPVAVTGGTVRSHGCAVKDRIATDFVDAEFVKCSQMRVTAVTIDTVTVRDVYGYSPRSATATSANPGTIIKQNRGRQATSAVTFNNSSFFGDILAEDHPIWSPTMDIGCTSANPIIFNDCYFGGGLNWPWQDVAAVNYDPDRTKVAILADPGPAGVTNSASFIVNNCQSQDGCIRWFASATEGSIVVKQFLQDTGGNPFPNVSCIEGNVFASIDLDEITLADAAVSAVAIDTGFDTLKTKVGKVYSSASTPVTGTGILGPTNIRSALWTTSGSTFPSPWQNGWVTSWPGGLAGSHPGANRAFGALSARFTNLFPDLSHWEDGSAFPTGITVTRDGLGPDGGTAIKVVADNTFVSDHVLIGLYPAASLSAASVGDYVAFGAWLNVSVEARLSLTTYQVGDIAFDGRGSIDIGRHIGTSGWQWCPNAGRISAISGGEYFIQLLIPSGIGTYLIYAPTMVYSPAAIGAADFYEFAGTLKAAPTYLAAGMVGTMEGQKFIAHGGSGIATGITNVVGVGSGQLTLTGTGTIYEPRYGADGTTILGWVALLQATVNP